MTMLDPRALQIALDNEAPYWSRYYAPAEVTTRARGFEAVRQEIMRTAPSPVEAYKALRLAVRQK